SLVSGSIHAEDPLTSSRAGASEVPRIVVAPWPVGQVMQTMPRMVFSALLLGLWLAWAGASACHARPHSQGNHGRAACQAPRVRLPRSSKDHPAHCPFAPKSQAAIPPDESEDDDSRARTTQPPTPEAALHPTLNPHPHFLLSIMGRQGMPEEPLFRTLCLLL